MLLTGYLTVSSGGIEAGVAEMLLKQPESVARIVNLNGVYRKSVS